MFRRPPKYGKSTYAAISAHWSNTTTQRRGLACELLGELKGEADQNDVDINGGDSYMSACRQQGRRARVMKETISRPLEKGLRFGRRLRTRVTAAVFVTTVKDAEGWQIYRHGCTRLNNELLQMKANVVVQTTEILFSYFALSRARALRRGPLNRTESAERCSEAAAKGSEQESETSPRMKRKWMRENL